MSYGKRSSMSMPTSMWLNEKQKEAVDKIVAAGGRGIAWWKIGEGKTRIALSVYFQMIEGSRTQLLVVCSPQAFRQWQDEIWTNSNASIYAKYTHFLSYGVLSGLRGKYWADHYAGRNDLALIVLDELWMYKNPHTKRSFNINRLTRNTPTVGLSGSMITNRNIEDIYGQAYAVGLGPVVAKSLTNFRSQFCIAYEEHGLKFAPTKEALPTIQKRLAPYVHLHFPKDVRESRFQYITVDPTKEQVRLFDTCQNDYYAQFENGGTLEIKNASNVINKLAQISDGFVIDDTRAVVSVSSNKYDRLFNLLADFADAGEPVLVWFAFRASLNAAYKDLGKEATCLGGDWKFDSEGWSKGKYKYCLATIGSGASLNDFANVQYSIIYSSPFSFRAVQQALGRTNRTGSRHEVCHYYFLQTDGGVDELINQAVRWTGKVEEQTIKTSTEVVQEYMKSYGNRPRF
jgi:hypothetical protein